MQTTIIHATALTLWRNAKAPTDQGLRRRKRAGVARWANQLVATVLFEGASQRPRAVTRPGWTGRALTAWASRAAHPCSLIISGRCVASGATGVYASRSRGKLTVRLDSRCNGWNKWPQIALAQWLSVKKLVACMREAGGLVARLRHASCSVLVLW